MDRSEADKLARLLESVKLFDKISPTKRVELLDRLNEIINEHHAGNPVDLRKLLEDFIDEHLHPLEQELKSPSDIKFYLDMLEIVTSTLTRSRAEIDPYAKELDELFAGNGGALESWCPEGLQHLEQLCENVVTLNFLQYFRLSLLNADARDGNAKQKSSRKPTQKKEEEVKRPKEVLCPLTDESQVQEKMKKALDVLCNVTNNGETFFPYLNFVVNPQSLEQTIHNMFILSFLYNELYITASVGHKHTLMIKPIMEHVKSSKTRTMKMKTTKKKTFTVSINYQIWRAYIEKLNITEAVLPDLCTGSVNLQQLAGYSTFAAGVNFLN